MRCKICGKEIKDSPKSLPTHLRSHDITSKEYYDKFIRKENEGFCVVCGKEAIFMSVNRGYSDRCRNLECSKVLKKEATKRTSLLKYGTESPNQAKEVKEKQKQAFINKYGVDNPWKAEEVKEKIKKTNLDKYGVDHPHKNKEIRQKAENTIIDRYGGLGGASKVTLEKMKNTNLERYGSENIRSSKCFKDKMQKYFQDKFNANSPFESEEVQEKIKQTNLAKYGVDNPWKSKQIIDKIKNIKLRNIQNFEKENNVVLLKKLNLDYIHRVVEDLDVIEFKNHLFIRNSDIKLAKELDKKYREEAKTYNSKYEVEIHEWLKSICLGEIQVNTRKVITPLELDFYIPNKNLAIELNGDYWHSVNTGRDPNYHLNKTLLCQEKGIQLIHIFEYEWNSKKDILKSIISSALGIYKSRIYARDCEVKEVSSKEAKKFLEENHLQGFISSKYRIGLYFENQLVQILCFGNSRFKKDEIELLRMCTRKNTQVIGGFSKLLKHSKINEFVSYVDLSKFSANSYLENDFKIIGQSQPNYKYLKGENVVNRFNAQKHKLQKLLGDNFDENKTETQNMIDNGWWKVYDCGNLKLKFGE